MYIIKIHYEATATNHDRAGETHDWYEGEGAIIIGEKDTRPAGWEITRYGYSTLAAAKRALKTAEKCAQWETELSPHWNVTVSLIEC